MMNLGSIDINSLDINSLDYVFIVDKYYNIVYDTRYDNVMNNEEQDYLLSDIVNKNFFKAFPNLNKNNSTIVKCMETGNVIVIKNQSFVDYLGRKYFTHSVTLPIMRKGEIVGVVELSTDAKNLTNINYNTENDKFNKLYDTITMEQNTISFNKILTLNNLMKNTVEKAKVLASTPVPILIYGETGTGKELFAQAMMNMIKCPKNKVIIQNCAAVPENLMESILFGTVKGAYTGADTNMGLFEQADNGVIFLDELTSIPYTVQAKLLRVIQDGTFRPLGSVKDKKVKVKVIAAMNVEPHFAMEHNIIRKDLFYRFSAGLLTIPPLRQRKDDIEMFISHYIHQYALIYSKEIKGITSKLKDIMLNYPWEGNVRELKNTVEGMISISKDEFLNEDLLPEYIRQQLKKSSSMNDINEDEIKSFYDIHNEMSEKKINNYSEFIHSFEKKIISNALSAASGNKAEASRLLGIPRQTLNYKIKKLGL